MSWNKNTINQSEIERLVDLLKDLKVPYCLTTIDKVRGLGLNDMENTFYPLLKLEVKDFIYIDQMVRTTDCDTDDVINTLKFSTKEGIPTNFEQEIVIDNC